MAFDSYNVINQRISSANLRTFFVGFDLGKYRNESLTDILLDTIVDFAFGYHTGILKKYDRRKLVEAARAIYKIKEFHEVKTVYVDEDSELSDCELAAEKIFLKRGEFGEMILHLLLRDFFNTVPLLSKFHFKDTDGATVHGFDIVHIGPSISEDGTDSLYLGESKLYSRKDGEAGKHGVTDLVKDIEKHFKSDFLNREIALISKKKDAFTSIDEYEDRNTVYEYNDFLKRKKHWFDILEQVEQKKIKLQDFFKTVTIPLVCTYQSKIFERSTDENSEDFVKELNSEIEALSGLFNKKLKEISIEKGEPIRTDLNIVLILFPIPSKKQLVKALHEQLYKQQG